jgi:hypothetical protein
MRKFVPVIEIINNENHLWKLLESYSLDNFIIMGKSNNITFLIVTGSEFAQNYFKNVFDYLYKDNLINKEVISLINKFMPCFDGYLY